MKKDEFYSAEPDEIEFIPFDIETTGFKAAEEDFVTTFVLHHSGTYHIFINTDGTVVEADTISEEVIEKSGIKDVLIHVCESETSLLENVGSYLNTHTGDMAVLTAFNGETYRGDTDFDVPFLRTRCFRCGVEWIFDGFWYSDIYEVFSKNSRFDTTIKAEPSLESMSKSDLKQFIEDIGYEIDYSEMLKNDIVNAINTHDGVSKQTILNWSKSKSGVTTSDDPDDINKSKLKRFIDEKSIDISYDPLSKNDIVTAIRERNYKEEMLVEWHEKTGRSIGTTEATTLDDIHRVIIEDNLDKNSWRRSLPFKLEVFTPFDPFESSGEAVTSYKSEDFVGVILHCFADVARTVNLNRVMAEYAPKKGYEPKFL